jgi:PPOX class probable F420-dependent enzyme
MSRPKGSVASYVRQLAVSEDAMQAAAIPALEPFVSQQTTLLTSYRRDGTPVGTPVHVVVEGDRAYFRTWDATWKFKRLRNNPLAEISPSTFRGTPTGTPLRVRARVLTGEEARHAAALLSSKYPVMHRLVPIFHRLTGKRTVHLELNPVTDEVEDLAA